MVRNDDEAKKINQEGEKVTVSVTIQKPLAAIYGYCCGISRIGELLAPSDARGGAASLDAGQRPITDEVEIINQEPPRLIAWRSLPSAAVTHAGSLTLRELPYERGTELKVVINYVPPQGKVAHAWTRAVGQDLESFLRVALFRVRNVLETGEYASTRGQPAGRGGGRDEDGAGDERNFAAAAEER